MNALFVATFLCLGALASASGWAGHGYDDGSWKGEGLAESQDHGHWGGNYLGYGHAGSYHHGAAPIGHDGRVVDTPEVAHAKAAHFAAVAAASHGAHAGWAPGPAYGAHAYGGPAYGAYHHAAAPLGHDGRVVDTPEVAHAKAAHFAAVAAASHGAHAYGPHGAW